ncbi:MAG TPA: hypothetical protein VE076_02550, partial [Nitrososphaeraceae archaeon]|nr:hypothetical protein [Nitrososphaeraceae archaeon]
IGDIVPLSNIAVVVVVPMIINANVKTSFDILTPFIILQQFILINGNKLVIVCVYILTLLIQEDGRFG